MRRREFITLFGSTAVAWPLAARAQQGERARRIGVLLPFAATNPQPQAWVGGFLQSLALSGWIIDRNVHVETHYATGNVADIRRHAAQLVALAPDIIVAHGTAAVSALLQATRTIPIVFPVASDPVGAGLVDSLARPGGDATGFLILEYDLSAKWLELLKQIAPPTKLTWSNLGSIRANMVLDHIPKHAGVYKLTFKLWGNTYTYIAEAGARGLRARIGDHANHPPAEGNKAEHLLHDLLREAGEADLSVCCTGVTLDEQKARRNFEKEAVAATQQERLMCLNNGGYSVDIPMQRFVLKSEEKMLLMHLQHVRAKLAKLV